MAKESLFNKIRKKVDKEYAEELLAQEKAEKEALKEQKKQEAIAEYKEKRTLTVGKFFEIAGLSLPENLADIADTIIEKLKNIKEDNLYEKDMEKQEGHRPWETLSTG